MHANSPYALVDTTPRNVVISGVLQDTETVYNGTYDATIEFFNSTASVPTVSIQQAVLLDNNYFRFEMDVHDFLYPLFSAGDDIFVRLSILDDEPSTLPFASVPLVIKAGTSSRATQLMDDNVFYVDYENKRVGIGTKFPRAELDVQGTVNATEYLFGDGSGLYNLAHAGSDNYNYLTSENGEFVVVTVNVAGKIMVGAREGIDSPDADLQVYGALLVEPNASLPSQLISGAGARWMWYTEDSVLRIGDTPSVYWDQMISGEDSIALGHASVANAPYAIITGGYYNHIVSSNAIVSSGSENTVNAENSIILGGSKNTVIGPDDTTESTYSSIILGGFKNQVQGQAVILGGLENTAKGDNSVVAGYGNRVFNEQSLTLGGKRNVTQSKKSMAIGSNITIHPNHAQSVVIGLSDELSESLVTSHINIRAPGGVGIGTTDTTGGTLTVAGAVTANVYYGDGSLLTNVKDPQSVWQLHPMRLDLLVYEEHLGVGTSNLLEALNVSGSIHITGNANEDEGTIQYSNNAFSVYKNGEWVGLQMVDTNTTYNATESLGLDDDTLTFYVTSKDAKIGHIKRWDGTSWVSGFMDLFIEEAAPERLNDLPLPKRLFLPTSNVAINVNDAMIDESKMAVPFSVFTRENNPSALVLYDKTGENDRMISVSTEPPGLHFQGHYSGQQFQQTPEPGAGIYLGKSLNETGIDDGLMMYVEDKVGALKDALFITSTNVHVMGIQPDDTDRTFYVDGNLASRSFVFRSDNDGTGIYWRSHWLALADPERAAIATIQDSGELVIQSANTHRPVVFSQAGDQVGMLLATRQGNSRFIVGSQIPRGGLDVLNGHVHVSDTYGVHFFNESTKTSGVSFNATVDDRIHIQTSSTFDVPNAMISKSANVDLNGKGNNDRHDLFINNVADRDTIVALNTVDGKNPGVILHVDGVQGVPNNNDFSQRGETYSFQMDDDDLVLKENAGDVEAITFHQRKFVGVYDATPTAALSLGADTVLLNQKGVYFKETDNSAGKAIVMKDDEVQVHASGTIEVIDSKSNPTIDIGPNGVGIHRAASRQTIERTTIAFEVDGPFTVSGDIYNQIDDKIFPLDVQNHDASTAQQTVNTIQIDTDSGLSLTGSNTGDSKLTVKAQGFYSRIKLPPCTPGPTNQTCLTDQLPNRIFDAATRNIDLRIIGRGITITANNREDRGLASDAIASLDTFNLINDLLAGGEITGPLNVEGSFIVRDKIYGNANGMRNINFHWQHVMRNDPAEPKGLPYRLPLADHENVINFTNDGEIYYTEGNVGIHHLENGEGVTVCPDNCVCELNNQCWEPSTLFEVVGTSNVTSLILFDGLAASDIRSTDNMHIESVASMGFGADNDIVFGRDDVMNGTGSAFKESMRINNDSQWLIGGVESSDYLVDVGRKSQNSGTEFRVESDSGMSLSLNKSTTDLAMKGHMKINAPANSAEVQLDSPLGYSFYTNTATQSLTLAPNGMAGVFTNTPQNTLDVNGSMAIGYEEKAPTDGLIVKNKVGVGMDSDELPINELEVGGSVIVGNTGTCDHFCIRGDGTYNLWIGGTPIGDEYAFVSKNISIKNGSMLLRNGLDKAMSIERGNSKQDTWRQWAENKGFDILTTKSIAFRSFNNSVWGPELMIDSAGAGRLGIGTVPIETVHIKDDDNDVLVKIKSNTLATVELKSENNKAIFGSNATGFHFKTHMTSLDNPEMTIVPYSGDSRSRSNTKVGILNDSPNDHYVVDINGTINATNYIVVDEFSESGYRHFQTVPTGVIMLWEKESIPTGWAECGVGSDLCPNMTNNYVKGVNDTYSNLKSTGGQNTATLSSVSHSHDSANHIHKLNRQKHAHHVGVHYTGNLNAATGPSDAFALSDAYEVANVGGGYVFPTGVGSHSHEQENFKHAHHAFTAEGDESIHDHGNSSTNSHSHGANTDQIPGDTIGTGTDSTGTNGDHHKHELDEEGIGNQPKSLYVRFIVKVDE